MSPGPSAGLKHERSSSGLQISLDAIPQIDTRPEAGLAQMDRVNRADMTEMGYGPVRHPSHGSHLC